MGLQSPWCVRVCVCVCGICLGVCMVFVWVCDYVGCSLNPYQFPLSTLNSYYFNVSLSTLNSYYFDVSPCAVAHTACSPWQRQVSETRHLEQIISFY